MYTLAQVKDEISIVNTLLVVLKGYITLRVIKLHGYTSILK